MFAKKSKIFIFVDSADQRVIGSKRSDKVAFPVSLSGVTTHVVSATAEFPPLPPFEVAYDPVKGLRKIEPPVGGALAALELTKRKIDCLIFLYAKLELIEMGIKAAFDSDDMRSFPISPESFFVYWKFMLEEKSLLRRKKRRFLRELEKKIDRAANDDGLDGAWREFRYSKSIAFLTPAKDTGIMNEFAKD